MVAMKLAVLTKRTSFSKGTMISLTYSLKVTYIVSVELEMVECNESFISKEISLHNPSIEKTLLEAQKRLGGNSLQRNSKNRNHVF